MTLNRENKYKSLEQAVDNFLTAFGALNGKPDSEVLMDRFTVSIIKMERAREKLKTRRKEQ